MVNAASAGIRPLARSLDPLTGESPGGYLLRLGHRLHLSPMKLARWIGCGDTRLSRRLLFDLDTDAFAMAAQLNPDEAATLTLAPWADRYPPIARALHRATKADSWLFNATPRYCPQCLAGDGSPIQEQHGGPWKKAWHLPISFACPDHQVLLRHGCPQGHPPPPSARLITGIGDSTLHPAQCRYPRRTGWPGRSSSCGARLDQADTTQVAGRIILTTQQRLLTALDPHHPADDARQYFTDLRVITALLCASWPAGQELLEPAMAGPVAWFERHLAQLNCRSRLNRVLRRTAAATLVQWSAGGSLGDAAAYLGINPKGGQFALTSDLYQWLDGDRVRPRFTTALKDLAADLDTTPGLLNYRHRRDALQTWSLHPGTWNDIVSRLPPVPGPVQPTFDDRKRQEASAFVWAHITQGELRFAPRPLETKQPESIRKTWAARRGTTWHQLTRPEPLNHYAQLRKHLTDHAQHLALKIDQKPW